MKKNILKFFAFLMVTSTVTTFTACNPEPDDSDLFTATGETVADFIMRKPEFSSFVYILSRVGLERNLSTYGEYTCFAPVNEAVTLYVDSLYNDQFALVPHNSMADHGTLQAGQHAELEWLSDSLCDDIARYHLANGVHTTIDMGGSGASIRTMLGRSIDTEGASDPLGRVTLNQTSVIIEGDSVLTNGVVHKISRVVPRPTRLLPDELDKRKEHFSIFLEALKLTKLDEALRVSKKNVTYPDPNDWDHTDTDGTSLYAPTECLVGFTLFVEPNSVLEANNIHNINDLIEYANNVYGNATNWYQYPREKGITISTGTDYENPFNALHMFVAYHILYASMPQNQLVFEYGSNAENNTYWNYVNGAAPYDYYETMLPGTLLKIWQPKGSVKSTSAAFKDLYINRAVAFNTLTDELGTQGSNALHTVIQEGIKINRTTDNSGVPANIQAYNGYIHTINGMLVYDANVPQAVLHERMRFDATTFLPEFINNGFRMASSGEISKMNGGGSGARIAFPIFPANQGGATYFDNVVSYTDANALRYNVCGAYNAWQCNTFQGWGNYDLAIKLPPLPTNTYEFRIFYTPMSHGGMMQFYMGKSSKMSDMISLDIPLDVRVPITDPRIGWTNFNEEEDKGVATDAALRNRGYMRGLYSYCDHAENNDGGGDNRTQRYTTTGNQSLRRILTRDVFRQSDEHWFRIKNVISDETDLKWQLDYVEFVPVDVVDNPTYAEDWY